MENSLQKTIALQELLFRAPQTPSLAEFLQKLDQQHTLGKTHGMTLPVELPDTIWIRDDGTRIPISSFWGWLPIVYLAVYADDSPGASTTADGTAAKISQFLCELRPGNPNNQPGYDLPATMCISWRPDGRWALGFSVTQKGARREKVIQGRLDALQPIVGADYTSTKTVPYISSNPASQCAECFTRLIMES